jgi:hypothetical protein
VIALISTQTLRELCEAATRFLIMENRIFENLTPLEICRKMSVICQKAADETLPDMEKRRLQSACDLFNIEADALSNLADKSAGEPLLIATIVPDPA